MDFPIFNSKELSDGRTYNLTHPPERLQYFHAKLGTKIDDVKEFLDNHSFVSYMLAKKLAGKGTYAKMVEEILGPERFCHISVGDVVRGAHKTLESNECSKDLYSYLEKNYRGFISLEDAVEALLNRSQDKVSVPSELLLALLKYEIEKVGSKGLFIDGLPRNLDQVSYSLYFRDLINFRDDPDFFVFIDVPMEIIRSRVENRVICPICQTSRNITFNPTKFVRYDETTSEFYFLCDSSSCSGYGTARYMAKEGDTAGIEFIKERLDSDGALMEKAYALQGIPKVLVRSAIPVDVAYEYVEEYEIQPAFTYKLEGSEVLVIPQPWKFKDDAGVESYTVFAATYVVNMFSQIHNILIN
jgi:adenylate kinase family enzyme